MTLTARFLLGLGCSFLLVSLVYADNTTTEDDSTKCKEGIVLPIWYPQENISTGDKLARGLVYFVCLVYMFVGVAIVADKFMGSIEVITSKEREVVIKKPNGETQTLSVRIWNETVSNLTLMALGSSAPEIMLSVIEIFGQNFEAGELGPGTIVGSAAFNLFVIIGICVYIIPNDEVRRIKHLRVFFVTMTWSVFAYIWLYLILAWSSYGVIEVWESVLTFIFFPLTVLTAYIADRRLLFYKYLSKNYRIDKRGMIVEGEGDVEMGPRKSLGDISLMDEGDEIRLYEEHRQKYMDILRELRQKHPECSMEDLEGKARNEILNRGPKSRAYYRLQANRKLVGAPMIRKKVEKVDGAKDEAAAVVQDDSIRLCFDPGHYTVMENVGQFAVTVSREGDTSYGVCVDYRTEDGTANAGSDYEPVNGTLIFRAGETHKQFFISVIDDDVFEEDEHFYVQINNPRFLSGGPSAINGAPGAGPGTKPNLSLGTPSVATVMILDDDHSGIYTFTNEVEEVPESIGEFRLVVNRYSGARGKVVLPYKTSEGTAKSGTDFEKTDGKLVFENNDTSKDIVIRIVDKESYEKDATFYIELGEPLTDEDNRLKEEGKYVPPPPEDEMTEEEKIAQLGKPRLGDTYRCMIRIRESKEFKNTIDKLFQKANVSLTIGSSSWREQFMEVFTVSAGDDDEEEGEEGEEGEEKEEKQPTWSDYAFHFITVLWKFIFAFVPPTDYFGGWACFVVSIIGIGLLTALVGDLASHFGCTIGLKDTVTAISFVALGTSVPDTFASKVAAVQDQYADSSIGNVTGSNAVNVFLGIGIAWSIAAIYHWNNGTVFYVDPGNLAFAVTLFCICATISCIVLMLRRSKAVGGELGGPKKYKVPTTILFVSMWVFYVAMNAMDAYGVIDGF